VKKEGRKEGTGRRRGLYIHEFWRGREERERHIDAEEDFREEKKKEK
jgi:hypothetical protein